MNEKLTDAEIARVVDALSSKFTSAELARIIKLLTTNDFAADSFYKPGEKYFVRTVTNYLVGKLEGISGDEMLFSGAAWIPDTNRWYDTLKEGTVQEAEPFVDDVILQRSSFVDGTKWRHPLFDKQK